MRTVRVEGGEDVVDDGGEVIELEDEDLKIESMYRIRVWNDLPLW
jgi:hypothetical protein